MQWLKKYLLRCKWDNYQLKTSGDVSILKLAVEATKLFNVTNKPNVALTRCTHYYIRPQCYSLHNMLYTMNKAYTDLKTTGSIVPPDDPVDTHTYRVDQWCLKNILPEYNHHDLYTAYVEMSTLINAINDLIKPTQHAYIERRCQRSLTTFLLVVDLLGVMAYDT